MKGLKINTDIKKYIHIEIHTHTYKHTGTYIHKHIYMHTKTHTHTFFPLVIKSLDLGQGLAKDLQLFHASDKYT